MALITAPWILAAGFECRYAFVGLADRVRRDPERFRKAEASQEHWAALTAETVASAAREQHARIGDIQALRRTLASLCPAERSSSSVGRAIDLFITTPVRSAKAFGDELNLTQRGAKVVLDKLVEAGVLEVEGGSRNRNFICRRAL
jgi:hypothetical protein